MSNEVFLLFLQIIIQRNVTLHCGVNHCRLTFEYDDFYFVKASTKKLATKVMVPKVSLEIRKYVIGILSKCLFEVWHKMRMILE